jgi:hypothetical protein
MREGGEENVALTECRIIVGDETRSRITLERWMEVGYELARVARSGRDPYFEPGVVGEQPEEFASGIATGACDICPHFHEAILHYYAIKCIIIINLGGSLHTH